MARRYARDASGTWRYASGPELGLAVPGGCDVEARTAETGVGMWAPELSRGFARQLADAEREFRLARRRLEQAAAYRRRIAQLAAREKGMSLRQIADCLDVSRARVQQLLEPKYRSDTAAKTAGGQVSPRSG